MVKLSNVPFVEIQNQDIFFFESLNSMIYATCLIVMFTLSQTTMSSDFPVNIWVASFMVFAFHGSAFLQSGVFCMTKQRRKSKKLTTTVEPRYNDMPREQ